MHRPTSALRLICCVVLLNLLMVGIASAQVVFYIGNDVAGGTHTAGCNFDKFQDGINQMIAQYPNGGNFEFRVRTDYAATRSGAINIPYNGHTRNITIAGGYDQCTDPFPNPSARSELDGFSGSGPPVLAISGHTSLTLTQLIIAAGNSTGNGGGISYNTSGCTDVLPCVLSLQDVHVTGNTANQGGGIFVNGGGTTSLKLLDNTVIDHNTAESGGGGIHLEGNTHLVASSPQTSISNNNVVDADGHGGGLDLIGNSSADIGSPGYYQFAVIDHNQAKLGGGISARDQANVRVFTTVSGFRTRIENNKAAFGGGVYLGSGNGHPQLCGHGAGINGNETAILSMGTPGQVIPINFNDTCNDPPGSVACAEGIPCNTIDGNTSTDAAAAAVYGSDTVFIADRIRIQGNQAGQVLKIVGNDVSSFTNCLISDNGVSGSQSAIVNVDAPLSFNGCTFTNNSGSDRGLFSTDEPSVAPFMTLQNSIVAEGLPTFSNIPTSQIAAVNSVASDADSYTSNFNLRENFTSAFFSFLNLRTFGDYHLSIDSSVLDYYADCTALGLDLDGRPRGIVLNRADKPCDPGAYEHQPRPGITFPSAETFDELDPFAPELPAGWFNNISYNSVVYDNTRGWFVTNAYPASGPFAAHAIDPGGAHAQSDSLLLSPEFTVVHSGRLTFDALFSLEPNYDGAVLVIKIARIDGFQEMTAAGGLFVSGGYNDILKLGATPNPIEAGCPGCLAWTGNSGDGPPGHAAGYEHVEVNLPPSVDGKTVQVGWRLGSDGNGPALSGFWLDNVHVDVGMLDDKIFVNSFGIGDDRSI